MLCDTTYERLAPPMKLLARIAHESASGWIDEKSDGLIFLNSQLLGESLGEFGLDHISEIGYFYYANSKLGREHRAQFEQMMDTAARFWSSF